MTTVATGPLDELKEARRRDPVMTLAAQLVGHGALAQGQMEDIRTQATRLIDEATDTAEAASLPEVSTITDWVYAP